MEQFGSIRHNCIAIIIGMLIVLPVWVYSAGMVICGGTDQPSCQMCHVVGMVNNTVAWLVSILGVLTALLIMWAGVRLVTSAGNTEAMTNAKSLISNLLIGYVIVLAAYLLIDYGMKWLVNEPQFGPWNTLSCIDQPDVLVGDPRMITLNNVTAAGHNSRVSTPQDINAAVNTIGAAGDIRAMVEAAARSAGLSGEQIKIFVALIHQESSMCRNLISPAGALGCGQLLLSTARQMDPSATRERLLNDHPYNLALAARYYATQLRRFGETRLALAAYNGGPGANDPSRDCPGLRKWECVWDSPGCHNTGQTNCRPNTGYIETRNYVRNIMALAQRL